jgi:WD40 repeat protein
LQGTQLVPLELTLDQISRVYFPIVGEYLGYGRVQMGRVYQSHGADWASVQKNEVEIDGATFWEIPEPLTEYDNMALAWSTNDRYLAFSAGNESLLEGPFVGSAPIWPRRWVIWDMEARLPVVDISYPHLALIEDRSSAVRGSPLCLAWSPDDQLLAQGFSLAFDSGIPSHEIRLTDPFTGEIIATLSGHSGSVIALAFSPDGTKLASVSWDGTLIIWDVSEYVR